jgi:DNA ligase-1
VDADIEYKNIGRVGTGITDAELEEMTELLRPYIESQTGKLVKLTPEIVLEVGYEEIQSSSNYSSGYALRFPRVIAVRHDKKPGDAETLEKIEQLFKS